MNDEAFHNCQHLKQRILIHAAPPLQNKNMLLWFLHLWKLLTGMVSRMNNPRNKRQRHEDHESEWATYVRDHLKTIRIESTDKHGYSYQE